MKDVFLALAALLAPRDSSIGAAMAEAIDQPAAYLEKHPSTAERLWSSKTPAQDRRLPWLALVDELLVRHRAAELDWREGKDDIVWNLERIAGDDHVWRERKAAIEALEGSEASTITWLRRIAAELAKGSVTIAALDIDSDSYVIVLLSATDYAKATASATRLGFVLKDIRTYDPNAG